MSAPTPDALTRRAREALGEADAFDLLAELVESAPTNLEDPVHQRYEKPNYTDAAHRLLRWAREFGLAPRLFDGQAGRPAGHELPGGPRPNVVIDLNFGSAETVLVMAHYDVVPVPAEQLARWQSPPHRLTARADGRLYGRGANDDLGSGTVAALLALRRLSKGPRPHRNVRLVIACDEETGGAGGIEAMRAHDDRLAADDPKRILRADVALIPDGSPHATAGSCGVVFLDTVVGRPAPLASILGLGRDLVGLQGLAKGWRSSYASPDWPDHQAPEAVITGRASLTLFDLTDSGGPSEAPVLRNLHAEADAANQIPEAVTLVFAGSKERLSHLSEELGRSVKPPYRLEEAGATALNIREGDLALQFIGKGAHGGYPHRGFNPNPPLLELLEGAGERAGLDMRRLATASFSVDLRLVPEMSLSSGVEPALESVRRSIAARSLSASVVAPEERCRAGYHLTVDHPALRRLSGLVAETLGEKGVFGEYGGTDASALLTVLTPRGEPIPAIVFGSMDREANIHQAEESVDPRALAGVVETIRRFVCEP
ncbi:MAG: M20/M25/M40 family metallo-hydrolase [Thermoplasmata archaeon]|nr:M20/M25/M40 family metallo-hydrolase [Thermoplasmata archaeon]